MERTAYYAGKHLTNVYASYPLMPESIVIMKQFTYRLIEVLQGYQFEKEFHIPLQYHMTLDYCGDLTDLDAYASYIRQKKRDVQPDFLCDGVTRWRSTVDNSINFLARAQHHETHNAS
jgi:hypothetical protein